MQDGSAAIGLMLARHGVVLFGWLFALAALVFHFYVNRRRNAAIDSAVVVVFAMLLTTLCDFRLVGDDLEYAAIARNLTSAYGLVDASDTVYPLRIAYTLLYAAAYAIGGLSGIPVFAALGFAGFCLAAFWFGRLVYGTAVAAAAVIVLMLVPREVVEAGIDSVVGAFVFVALALLVLPPGRHEIGVGLAAALLLALGYLSKEIAVLAIGFPVLLLIFRVDRQITRRLLAGFVGALVLVAIAAAVARAVGPVATPWFTMTEEKVPAEFDAPLHYALSLAKGALAYFWWPGQHEALIGWAPVFALLPVALALIAYRAWRGGRADKVMLAALLIWAPLIAFTGQRDWRAEQALNFLALGFLALAELARSACRGWRWHRPAFAVVTAGIATSCLVQSVIVDAGLYSQTEEITFEGTLIGRLAALRPVRFETRLTNGPNLAALGATMPRDGRMWASPVQQTGLTAMLASGNHYWTAPIPLHALIHVSDTSGYLAFSKGWIDRVTRPIWGIYAADSTTSPLFLLYRDDLLAGFRDVSLVMVNPHMPWVRDLPNLLERRLLTRIAVANWDEFPIVAYRWDPEAFAQNVDRRFIDRHALTLLRHLETDRPDLFAWYRDQLRAGGIELDAAMIDTLSTTGPRDGNPVTALR